MEHTITSTESAVEQTLNSVGTEFGAPGRLSADEVGVTDQGEPVLSVINLDTREHWQLIVRALPLAKR